ncbi:uncharacterized protein MELLADRAFT_60212 [Melampsora larici-populina 98AG31]|uniref:Secreted protein n=1 Tax=Melampsora larici-populina (strain 98AG31 / pathotype 3-4-7) TaxID=747676 RepID=F4RAI1_MELLP|nr:uncharacterized protein MELLADRAFT_60212 [Melampsora larici-populina 98AG31]EGG10483.1 hypothetical protein MELLADRAFT_60212 [Melampsora larici-populina 98AG31]
MTRLKILGLYWYISIHFILQSQFFFPVCTNVSSVAEDLVKDVLSKPEVTEVDTKGLVEDHSTSRSCSPDVSTHEKPQLLPQEVRNIWDQIFQKSWGSNQFPELYNTFLEVLLSNPEEWSDRMIYFCETLELEGPRRDINKQIVIFQVLNLIGEEFDLDIKAVQAILSQLTKMDSDLWMNDLKIAIKSYTWKMKDYIKRLSEDREILEFSSMEKNLGKNGLKLSGDWSPGNQKQIFLLWTSCMNLYTQADSERKRVIETQVVYINQLQEASKFPGNKLYIGMEYMHWAHRKLKEYKETMIDYIKSLKVEGQVNEYASFQSNLKRYGINILNHWGEKEKMKLLIFWSNYMPMYLELSKDMNMFQFQLMMEELITQNFEETSLIMNQFLDQLEGSNQFKGSSSFFPFIKYFSENTGSPKFKLKSIDILNVFEERTARLLDHQL